MGGWKVIGERGTMGWTEGRGVEKGSMVSVGGVGRGMMRGREGEKGVGEGRRLEKNSGREIAEIAIR